MNKLKVAIVGCGGIAEHYMSVYRELDWLQVVACVDTNVEAARAAAKYLQHSNGNGSGAPRVDTAYQAALTPDVDIVIINTPNHFHHEQAIAALSANKHVLLQKPVAPTLREAQEIAAAAAKTDATSGLYMSYFDQPIMYDFKDMIAAGWFGKVSHYYARLMHRWGQVWSQQSLAGLGTWRGSAEQTGGGCFVQLAVHYVHLLEWLSGERIARVTAKAKNLHCPGLEGEDLASAILEFPSGTLATLDTAWCFHGEQLSIHGTEGTAQYLNNRLLVLESKSHSFQGRVIEYPTAPPKEASLVSGNEQISEVIPPAMGDYTNPYNQHRAFLEAVRDRTAPFVSISSGAEDLRIVAAFYESLRRGTTAEVVRDNVQITTPVFETVLS